MKKLIGIILIIAGVAAGLYFGLYWAFIGGIITVIKQIRAPDLNATTTALAIVRIIFAGLIGYFSAFILIIPGYVLVKSK